MTSPLTSASVAAPQVASGASPIDLSPRDLATARTPWPLWAIFLGCSWTWCIGMFLPILFIRDYGILGWLVFAIPNVLGAAAMGFVIRDAQTSARLLHLHHSAVIAFSTVTASFNFYFVMFFIRWLGFDFHNPAVPGALILGLVIIVVSGRSLIRQAELVTASSLVIFWIVFHAALTTHTWPPLSGQRPTIELIYLAPLCLFGFLACPYLDATFHWPIAVLDVPGRHRAFAVGFGVFFLAMILLTALYTNAAWVSLYVTAAVAFHCTLQAIWKVWLHATIIRRYGRFWEIAFWILFLSAILAFRLASYDPQLGTNIYLCFLSFYALIFPAYVLIVMLPPRGRELAVPNKRTLSAWIVTVLLCLPCLWEGFILERRVWLVPIVFVVLAARLLAIRPMILPGTAANA
jgi:hypothetical protein